MKLAILTSLMVIAVIACGSDVVAETKATGLTDDTQLQECLTALAVISIWHTHPAPVTVETAFQRYEGAPLQGSADIGVPEFTASTSIRNYTPKATTQPVDLLNRYCLDVIDFDVRSIMLEEISTLPK
jgi:hypothetical protein